MIDSLYTHYSVGGSVWMSYRKSIAWRQKHWTDKEWPSYNGANWTVTVIALHSSIRLKANHIFMWSIFRSFVFASVIHTCLTLFWSCLRSTASYLIILLWFWVVWVKKTKMIASSRFYEKLNLSEKSNVEPFLWQSLIYKNGIHNIKLVNI